MSFTLPELPYAYDALAPYMSRETLEYHHDKHHLAYVNNGNKLLKGSAWEGKPLEEVVKGAFGKNDGLFNNAGQHYNHLHFWQWMKPNGGGDKLSGPLEKQIKSDLGSLAKMKEDFIEAGVSQFGSGWAWLAVKGGKIVVMKTPNGESPLVHGGKPILGCDVWEHAYYIDYRNRRPDLRRSRGCPYNGGCCREPRTTAPSTGSRSRLCLSPPSRRPWCFAIMVSAGMTMSTPSTATSLWHSMPRDFPTNARSRSSIFTSTGAALTLRPP
jgi:Fe-Mn family superoxide dismutase